MRRKCNYMTSYGSVNEKTINPTVIRLNKTSLTMTEGDTDSITASISPTNATNKTVEALQKLDAPAGVDIYVKL